MPNACRQCHWFWIYGKKWWADGLCIVYFKEQQDKALFNRAPDDPDQLRRRILLEDIESVALHDPDLVDSENTYSVHQLRTLMPPPLLSRFRMKPSYLLPLSSLQSCSIQFNSCLSFSFHLILLFSIAHPMCFSLNYP